MLNLLNLFSIKLSPLLSQFHILLFYACYFMSCIFMSCNFMHCTLVRQFHVRHFHVQHFQRPHYDGFMTSNMERGTRETVWSCLQVYLYTPQVFPLRRSTKLKQGSTGKLNARPVLNREAKQSNTSTITTTNWPTSPNRLSIYITMSR